MQSPEVFLVPAVDPQETLRNPRLTRMAADGWTVAAVLPIQEAHQPDRPKLMMILWPPVAKVPTPRQWHIVQLVIAFILGLVLTVVGVAL